MPYGVEGLTEIKAKDDYVRYSAAVRGNLSDEMHIDLQVKELREVMNSGSLLVP